MRSRVMPGSLVTIERRVPVKRLKSVDLPTLGRPRITRDGSCVVMKLSGDAALQCSAGEEEVMKQRDKGGGKLTVPSRSGSSIDSSKLKVEKRRAERDNAETLSAQRQRGKEWPLAPALVKVFQNGKSWYTPGSFRMSGKQRSYRIRNLEECAAHRKQTVCKMTFCAE